MLERVFRIHQFQFLCDHQELARPPKGPPRRASMKEMSFRNMYGHIYLKGCAHLPPAPFYNLQIESVPAEIQKSLNKEIAKQKSKSHQTCFSMEQNTYLSMFLKSFW